jgi:hypothetical protein
MMPFLQDLLVQTLTNPRHALRRVLEAVPGTDARLLAAGAVIVVSVLVTQVLLLIDPPGPPWDAAVGGPVRNVAVQAGFLLGAAWAMSGLARWFGGVATFSDAVMAVTWIDFVLLVLQIAQLVLVLLLPFLGLPLAVLTVGLFFWLLTHFTAGLNGFASMGKTFAGVLVTTLIGGFVMMFLMGLPLAPPVPA